MNRFFRSAFFPLIVIVLLVWLASQTLIPKSHHTEKMTYSELQTLVKTDPSQVEEVEFNPSKRAITATLNEQPTTTITVHYPVDQSAVAVPEPARATRRSSSTRRAPAASRGRR